MLKKRVVNEGLNEAIAELRAVQVEYQLVVLTSTEERSEK